MKISDLLRNLADQIEAEEQGASQDAPHDQEDGQPDETTVFVSPLQQKLELLKKSVGVDNIYDNPEEQSADDELEQIKKLSGLSTVIQQMSNDPADPN